MKTLRVLSPALLIASFLLAMTGCISDDFTTSPSDTLTFSSDTVSFDTVFTDLGTPTARLKVFNKAKKSVNISSIKFQSPDTHFSMNVDGQSGREFSDVEIRGGDSIFVFIECFIPEAEQNTPQLVEDNLQFVTNGVTQNVVVEAWGQNVTRLRNVTVEDDMVLTAEMPYVVFDTLTVAPGASLRIEPGANVLFHDGASLKVSGTLTAVGAPGRQINLRGDRLDNVLPNVGYDILAGQWHGVRFTPESFDNRMEYVDMRSTRIGLVVDSCADLSRRKLTLVNSWLHNSQSNALEVNYAWVDAYGCVFSEAARAAVFLAGGIHNFVQCTLSNYYLFTVPSDPLLTLEHCMPEDLVDKPELPLMEAYFQNCIFYGMPADINIGDLTGSNVYLQYCSLKSPGEDDANFQNCLWDTDPLFLTVRNDYYFNYHVQEDSPVIGMGNSGFLNSYTYTDIDGVNRLTVSPTGSPTLGAYAQPEPSRE